MPNYYSRPSFVYDPGTGVIILNVPLCSYQINPQDAGITTVKYSLDGTPEIHYLNYKPCEFDLSLSDISESDYLAFENFKQYAMKGQLFAFYPYSYASSSSRPSHEPEYWEDCFVMQGHKWPRGRSEGIAGRYDFTIKFWSKTPIGGIT